MLGLELFEALPLPPAWSVTVRSIRSREHIPVRTMTLNPYRPPRARVADPRADERRAGMDRIIVLLALLAWLTPVLASAAIWADLLAGAPIYVRWLGISVDLAAPAYGLFVAVPVCLFTMAEALSSRGLGERLLTPMLFSATYGVATVAWYYMLD